MSNYHVAALVQLLHYASRKVMEAIEYYGSAEEAYAAGPSELCAAGFLTAKGREYSERIWQEDYPERLAKFCTQHKVEIVTIYDSIYPESLHAIASPPVALYVAGALPRTRSAIAMVGSRKATSYGLRAAREIAEGLASRHITIVSGGALGIDRASHEGALAGQGPTIAVLGTGIDYFYPRQNIPLLEEIRERGAVVTEFAPGTQALPRNFPVRNRIIVGLASKGVLVVEAAEVSGAMLTAEMALDENRDVFCVPGSIYSPTSKGTNALIRDGAHLVESAEDILSVIGLSSLPKCVADESVPDLFSTLDTREAEQATKLLAAFDTTGSDTMESLILKTGLPVAEISNLLLNLQLGNLIRELPNKHYVRV